MNRLIIIGNGFDLAHGLPTSYKHFIDDYWKGIISNIGYNFLVTGFFEYEDKLVKTSLNLNLYDYYSRERLIKECEINSYSDFKIFKSKYDCDQKNKDNMGFKNDFFRVINEKNSENWVDIENEYYNKLKIIVKHSSLNSKLKKVIRLNTEFEQVKTLLETYLKNKVVNGFSLDFTKNQDVNWMQFYKILSPISLFSNEENVLKQFINSEDVKEIKEHFEKEKKEELVNNLYFLNFNYTPLATIYSDSLGKDDRIETNINFIHGEIDNKKENKINFGFGDEMDDDYKIIENINDNEYLRNFKSFQYLQNSNYSNLLNYIESGKFQVLIMGHSCGLSDRTLLNTIFEHKNCCSIKVFYHEKKDENGIVISDNYTELIQNISRHFNDKKLMRSKIVNKTLCKPLPQIKLPMKK